MTSNDLLDTLARNHWRLDTRHDTSHYRCMYWCVECGLWRCVVESGEWFPHPREAIEAAVRADATPP